jgi:hypothetical protein
MVYPHIQYHGPAYPVPREPRSSQGTRELDSRTSDGIHVRLLWHEGDGRVSVAVDDTKTGEAFELTVRDGQRAVDVFQHPFAYASARRSGTGGHLPDSASAQVAA